MSLEKRIAILIHFRRVYMFRDDEVGMKKYAEICNRLAELYEMEINQC